MRLRLIGVAALAVATLGAPMVASAQPFSFDRPGSNYVMHLAPGSIVTAPDTLVPEFGGSGPMRGPRANPVGRPMLIEVPDAPAAPRPRNVLILPVVWSSLS
ncbi:MAG TPA: hypothetical protein VMV13_05965 [Candidatus Binataceae bacterium]|nr:hypothetical protein [Candidatus Binataceae bacterium]